MVLEAAWCRIVAYLEHSWHWRQRTRTCAQGAWAELGWMRMAAGLIWHAAKPCECDASGSRRHCSAQSIPALMHLQLHMQSPVALFEFSQYSSDSERALQQAKCLQVSKLVRLLLPYMTIDRIFER